MYAEDTTVLGKVLYGLQRHAHLLRRVADQRWEQSGCAIASVSVNNLGDRHMAWRVIEEDISAAVDLRVNEARCQPAALRQLVDRDVFRQLSARTDPGDAFALYKNRGVLVNNAPIEDGTGCDCMLKRDAHVVRVIFCRCCGLSMSTPSRSPSATTIR